MKGNDGQRFVDEFRANAAHLERAGAYDPAQEHDACGVGFVAAIDGQPRRTVVEGAIRPVDDIPVTRPGPRLADGLAGLALAIHRDLELPDAPPAPAFCPAA